VLHWAARALRAERTARAPKIAAARFIAKILEFEIRYESAVYPSKERPMHIHVSAFAVARELIGAPERPLELSDGARVADAWRDLERSYPGLAPHRGSMRIARNGRLADSDETLSDGDEIAILPPVGGG
jgi:MoaD family protein